MTRGAYGKAALFQNHHRISRYAGGRSGNALALSTSLGVVRALIPGAGPETAWRKMARGPSDCAGSFFLTPRVTPAPPITMTPMNEVLLVLTNVPDEATGVAIARRLVDDRLSACVNLLPAVRSIYRWQGAAEETAETTLLIKTTQQRYHDVEAAIRAQHPYELPEIIALPVAAGLPAYLAWVATETKKDMNV